jgi:D-lactate dehydrogenase
MKVAFFSSKPYDRQFFDLVNADYYHEISYFETHLDRQHASLAAGFPAICMFVNDIADAHTLEILAAQETRLLALRSAGFDRVDLQRAKALGIKVVRVPAYSPYAVAEHAVALILTLNRKIYKAYNRVREDNFALDGLLGFDLHGSTVGVVGTGKIGMAFAQIMQGFGCKILGYDPYPNNLFPDLPNALYVTLPELLAKSDIISLHCSLTPENHHLIDTAAIDLMKSGVMLINTSRGGLLDTSAVIEGIKSGKIGYLGIDVYEREDRLFFQDLSETIVADDIFQLLLCFPNVVITAHQAFFTRNALKSIAVTTLENISEFERGLPLTNEVAYFPPTKSGKTSQYSFT